MAEQDPIAIEARSVPLSHIRQQRGYPIRYDKRIYLAIGSVLLIGWLGYLLVDQTFLVEQPKTSSPTGPSAATPTNASESALLPFAQTQQQLARERAQAALAGFVEQQIQLETQMQVIDWGETGFAAALANAENGDLLFATEQFDAAIAAYEQAREQLKVLIEQGHARVTTHLQTAQTAIDNRQPKLAQAAIDKATSIEPEHPQLSSLTARIEHLPKIIRLFRDAKNHELSSRYPQALANYEEIEALDPLTTGLTEAVAAVERQALALEVEQTISRGFAKLTARDYAGARQAFTAALALEANNTIARGGLQQVARAHDLSVIDTHRNTAERAMAAESWQAAIESFQAVLTLDKNIQFATAGLAQANAHQNAQKLLTAITSQPTRLSSQTLFLQAEEILRDAQKLSRRGPALNTLLETTQSLLDQYRDPVDVHLVSDNRMDVMISNVGRLGVFGSKQLTLRPGQYTIRGSQDGCRDLHLSILVVPGIEPIDVRCQEPL